jgi:hypothetical protein
MPLVGLQCQAEVRGPPPSYQDRGYEGSYTWTLQEHSFHAYVCIELNGSMNQPLIALIIGR